MRKPKSKFQLARWLNVDLWGEILNSQKSTEKLFKKIYIPSEHRSANFVLRIDKVRPKARKKVFSKFSLAMWERRKLCAYYDLSLQQLRRCALRSQNLNSSYSDNFILALESRLNIILWRVGFFSTPIHAKSFISHANVLINNQLTTSVNKVVAPGDYITFRTFDYSLFLSNLRRGIYHYRNSHIIPNFRLPSLFLLSCDPTSLFYYFSIDHRNVFFTTGFRRK